MFYIVDKSRNFAPGDRYANFACIERFLIGPLFRLMMPERIPQLLIVIWHIKKGVASYGVAECRAQFV